MGRPTADATPAKDRPFNAYRVPRGDAAKAVVAAIRRELDTREQRTRQRCSAAEARYSATIAAVVADALHHRLSGALGAVTVPRSNATLERRSRYRPAAIGGTLPCVVDAIAAAGFLHVTAGEWSRGFRTGTRSTMRAAPRLARLAKKHDVALVDLGREGLEETVVLKGSRVAALVKGPRPGAPLLEYRDDLRTTALRKQMGTINAQIAGADLDFQECCLDRPRSIDCGDRRMRRVFTRGSFTSGGRLYGGFWHPLSKIERADGLTIGGEETSELDYSGMGPRILYGIVGVVPRFHDPYAVPGFEQSRAGLKRVFGAEVFRDDGRLGTRFPRDTRKLFPASAHYSDVLSALAAAHPEVAHLLGSNVGHDMQHRESNIMVEVLLRLGRRGIVGLPIHDAVLVGASHAEVAAGIMEQVTLDLLGFAIPVRMS